MEYRQLKRDYVEKQNFNKSKNLCFVQNLYRKWKVCNDLSQQPGNLTCENLCLEISYLKYINSNLRDRILNMDFTIAERDIINILNN